MYLYYKLGSLVLTGDFFRLLERVGLFWLHKEVEQQL